MIFYATDRPEPPQNLTVTEVTANSATLQWEEPEQDGGSPIVSFLVEKRDIKRKMWQTVCEAAEETEIKVGVVGKNSVTRF